jgi:hypothetical protein
MTLWSVRNPFQNPYIIILRSGYIHCTVHISATGYKFGNKNIRANETGQVARIPTRPKFYPRPPNTYIHIIYIYINRIHTYISLSPSHIHAEGCKWNIKSYGYIHTYCTCSFLLVLLSIFFSLLTFLPSVFLVAKLPTLF